jgi:probable FeS assembly SUF system protein SufT
MSETVQLRRDCPVVLVPSGQRAVLAAGEHVAIVQRLGGSITVQVENGALARIDGVDADALGIDEATSAHKDANAEGASRRLADPSRAKATEALVAPEAEDVLEVLREVYDPEIPVNVVDLGLIYGCEIHPSASGYRVHVWMSMTAPGCGMGDVLRAEAIERILEIPKVTAAEVELVFDPPWDLGRMSEAARLQLGMW